MYAQYFIPAFCAFMIALFVLDYVAGVARLCRMYPEYKDDCTTTEDNVRSHLKTLTVLHELRLALGSAFVIALAIEACLFLLRG